MGEHVCPCTACRRRRDLEALVLSLAGTSATQRRRQKELPASADVVCRPAHSCDAAGHSVESRQFWGCPEARERRTLQARVGAAVSGAPAKFVCV